MENIKKLRRIKATPYILILGFILSLILGIMSGKIFTGLMLWLFIFSWIYFRTKKQWRLTLMSLSKILIV